MRGCSCPLNVDLFLHLLQSLIPCQNKSSLYVSMYVCRADLEKSGTFIGSLPRFFKIFFES